MDDSRSALIRGNTLVNTRAFLIEHHGIDALDQVSARLTEPAARALHEAGWSEWYPASTLDSALVAIDALLRPIDPAVITRLGRFQLERDLASPLGWLFRLFPPNRLIEHLDVLWRRFHSSGVWSASSSPSPTHLSLTQWRGGSLHTCTLLRAYLESLASALNRRPLTFEHPRCAFISGASCEYRIATHHDHLSPLPFPHHDQLDAAVLGRELAQLPTQQIALEAIATILERLFPSLEAAVLLGEADPRHAITIGHPRATYDHLWVLEQRGRIVARLHATLERTGPYDPRLRLLGELVPWFALALDHRASPSALTRPLSWDERSSLAATRWALTPRQREVLTLLVQGYSNRQISLELDCAEGTVEVHVRALFKKTRVTGRTELSARVAELEALNSDDK